LLFSPVPRLSSLLELTKATELPSAEMALLCPPELASLPWLSTDARSVEPGATAAPAGAVVTGFTRSTAVEAPTTAMAAK
jgi:hypothetical protein